MNASDALRVVLITPLRNEIAHVDALVAGVVAQTRPVDGWIVVDDGSTDGSFERLTNLLAPLPYAQLVRTPPNFTVDSGDRNLAGGPDRAWNFGLGAVDVDRYTHLGKLDADIVLPPDFIARLLERFRTDPRLGMASGVVSEPRDGGWWTMSTPADHVTPQARLYSRECFEAIGGMPPYMGADMVTTLYAKMRGYTTKTFADITVRHLRPMATADGVRRGRERQGAYQYVVHYGFVWIVLRAFVVAVRFRPYVLSGWWFLLGYIKAALRHMPRVEDPELRAFARHEQRQRMIGAVTRRVPLVRMRSPK